jgi:hypothetical protein
MIRHLHPAVLALLLAPAAAPAGGPEAAPAAAPEPAPAVLVRMVRPDVQLVRLLSLFEGARVPNPAAALASYRRATGDHDELGKAAQAGIAFLNPDMIDELRRLDGATVALGTAADWWWWRATIPRDDGTFAALAAAMALTDGAALPRLEGAAVDRLGPPGAPLMARCPDGGLALALDRDALTVALHALAVPPPAPPALPSGWHLTLDPSVVPPRGPLAARRVALGLAAGGCRRLEATAALEGDTLAVDLRGTFERDAPGAAAAIDPAWLDWVPAPAGAGPDAPRVAAAVVLALEPDRAAWDRVFAVADRVEKADPARARVAPIRARLGLAALAVGLRPERDVFPHVRGITAAGATDGAGRPAGWLVALHAADEAAAERIAARLAGPLAARLGAVAPARRGRTVLLASAGPLHAAALDAADGRIPSEAPALRAAGAGAAGPPSRLAVAWPGRLRLAGPLAAGLDDAPPLAWAGGAAGESTWDRLRWPGLKGVVRRALERLPMAPAEAGKE